MPIDWHSITTGVASQLGAQDGVATNPANHQTVLFQWGVIRFEVYPLNIHEFDHDTETDWAHKEIAGAAIYREWVGENDERLFFRGHIFPYRIGGMDSLNAFEQQRRAGYSNLMVRGDGRVLGWFVCEKLVRANTFLSAEGVGQQIAFEAAFARVPVPEAEMYYRYVWSGVRAGGL